MARIGPPAMMPVPDGAERTVDLAGAEVALAVMVQRAAVAQRNADHRLLGRGSRLADRFRHFARLAVTEAGAALAVADDDQRRETEALAALHGLGDAVDVDELLDQLLAAIVVAATATTVVTTATAATTVAAATATATAAATRTAAREGRELFRRAPGPAAGAASAAAAASVASAAASTCGVSFSSAI